MRLNVRSVLGSAMLAAATVAAPAGAVTFNLIDIGGAAPGTLARDGFERAAGFWASVLTDNVTINLQIGFQSLPPRVLGSTRSSSGILLIDDTYAGLASDAKSAVDTRAVNNLPALVASQAIPGLSAIEFRTSAYADPAMRSGIDTSATILDNDGGNNNTFLDINTANIKALGYTTDSFGVPLDAIDGRVLFSSDFGFDFNPYNGIAANRIDFIGVATHEIGHALGFVSGVDTYDVLGGPNGPLAGALTSGAFGTTDIGEFAIFSALDLFRYGNAGLDLSVGTESYFSIDGGTPLFGNAGFSTGSFNGDEYQASHWKNNGTCSGFLGIMNPYLCDGTFSSVTALDLAAFDAIGWDVNVDVLANPGYTFNSRQIAFLSGAPEPGNWALLIAGFGLTGAMLRRRRDQAPLVVA